MSANLTPTADSTNSCQFVLNLAVRSRHWRNLPGCNLHLYFRFGFQETDQVCVQFYAGI